MENGNKGALRAQGNKSVRKRQGSVSQLMALVSSHRMVVLSLALFNGWVFAMSWGGVFSAPPDHATTGVLSDGIWIVSLFVCTAVLGLFLLMPPSALRVRPVALRLCALLMSASMLLSALSIVAPEAAMPLFLASSITSGLGTGAMTAYWGAVITRYDSSVVLRFVVVSLLASAFFVILVLVLPKFISYLLMAVAPFVMAWSFRRGRGCGEVSPTSSWRDAAVSSSEEAPPLIEGAKNSGTAVTLAVFMGLVVVLGISAGLLRSLISADAQSEQIAWMFSIAAILASIMLLVSRVPERGESFALFYRAIAFIAAAFIVFTVVVSQAVHQALIALGVHTIGFVYFYGLLWVFCSIYSQRQTTRSVRVFAGGFFANQIGQIIGATAGDGLGAVWDTQFFITAASNAMIYLLLFVVIALLARMSNMSEGTRQPMMTDRSIERACAVAAEERGLTKRESEILPYLIRGFDRGYIAEQLTVSTETIKSHIRHIYEKFDVHSRVELFNAVAQCAVEQGER